MFLSLRVNFKVEDPPKKCKQAKTCNCLMLLIWKSNALNFLSASGFGYRFYYSRQYLTHSSAFHSKLLAVISCSSPVREIYEILALFSSFLSPSLFSFRLHRDVLIFSAVISVIVEVSSRKDRKEEAGKVA